jgi:hypothetical protein
MLSEAVPSWSNRTLRSLGSMITVTGIRHRLRADQHMDCPLAPAPHGGLHRLPRPAAGRGNLQDLQQQMDRLGRAEAKPRSAPGG